jgi:LAO/AO transport system kinase
MLDLDQRERDWNPPVILTNARSGEGITELVETIGEHIEFLKKSGLMEKKDLKRSQEELEDLMRYRLTRKLLDRLRGEPEYTKAIDRIAKRNEDPYTVAERLIAEFLVKSSKE